jgi:hypothetical protein
MIWRSRHRVARAILPDDIEFAHRNVTVYLPPEVTQQASGPNQENGAETGGDSLDKKLIEASAAAAIAARTDEETKKSKKTID